MQSFATKQKRLKFLFAEAFSHETAGLGPSPGQIEFFRQENVSASVIAEETSTREGGKVRSERETMENEMKNK